MGNALFLRRSTVKKNNVEKPAKERILDAAERLFAQRGFYGVSVRDITHAVGVDVALVSYHFGAKRALFTAVFERRAELLNAERLALLEAVRRAAMPKAPSLEAIVSAFTQPLLERSGRGGAGWKSYFALVAQVNNSPEWGPVLMTRHFDPLVDKFIAVLREALPDCPPREIYWGYQFLTGALTLTFAETGRIDKLSGGLCKSSDLDSVHERLAPYVAAGFRALCVAATKRGVKPRRKIPNARRTER
jgi:AcrR family transcriptional regulator